MEKEQLEKPEKYLGVRHVQYILLFSVSVITYGMRTVLNVGIIAMISKEPPDPSVPTYPEWSDEKNVMLSSIFWGYICFQVVAGQVAKNYGPKLFLSGALIISSLLSIAIPFMGAQFGYKGIIAARVLQGMSQGFIFPSVHNLISAWVPIFDRAKVASVIYAGSSLGTVISMPLTGFISSLKVGWPMAFYLYGGMGLVWSVFWLIFGCDSPQKHRTISQEERRYIEHGTSTEEKEKVPTPWKYIFKSLPFYAILACHCGNAFGFWTLVSETPIYMEKILKFKITSNSLLTALPYFVSWLLNFAISPIADYLIVRGYTSVGVSRKIFTSIGFFSPAIALLCLNFVGSTDKTGTMVTLVIGVGLNAAYFSGFNINHIDISPIHAGTLMGLTNSVSTIFSILAPLSVDVIKAITGYEEDEKRLWNVVFSTAGVIYLGTGIFYQFAGSGEVQSWNNLNENQEEKSPPDTKYSKTPEV